MPTDLSMIAKDIPPMFGRDEVKRLFGGLIAPGHLANLDCIGEGPPRIRIGRRVGYLREPFLEWLGRRMESVQ